MEKLTVTPSGNRLSFRLRRGRTVFARLGPTGESPTLNFAEHKQVIAEVIRYAAGKIKVMAGTGSNSTTEALELTQWAADQGADAALVVAPYYNKPTQEGFYQHYRTLAEAVDLPICVYNIPRSNGQKYRARNDHPSCRAEKYHHGQRGDRFA